MSPKQGYRVSEVARMTGVTIRTLHHYESIQLLVPSGRSAAGYRLYSDQDLLRLQQILIQRELGLSLEHIRQVLDDRNFDYRAALVAHRRQMEQRQASIARTMRAIDAAIEYLDSGTPGDVMNTHALFDGFDPTRYEVETQTRWGNTNAYKTAARRTGRYCAADWIAIRDESAAIYGDAVRAMSAGIAADSSDAMAIAERHRLSIERWFYRCDPDMHARLADLYEADSRFAANIDKHGPGLTQYLAAAIRANAARSTPEAS